MLYLYVNTGTLKVPYIKNHQDALKIQNIHEREIVYALQRRW
jgi:hypothetical protein